MFPKNKDIFILMLWPVVDVALRCYAIVVSDLSQFVTKSFLILMILTFCRSTGNLHCRTSLRLGLCDVSSSFDLHYVLRKEKKKKARIPDKCHCVLSGHHGRRNMILFIWKHDTNFNYLVRVKSAEFFYCKINIFPLLWLISILWRDMLRLCKYVLFICFSTKWWFLPKVIFLFVAW